MYPKLYFRKLNLGAVLEARLEWGEMAAGRSSSRLCTIGYEVLKATGLEPVQVDGNRDASAFSSDPTH